MGGFESVALGVLGAVQNRQRQRAQNSALATRQQAEANQLLHARKINEHDKRKRLASLQAAQRARFGAAGIGRGGSADAVLDGLSRETEQSIRDGRATDRMRLQRNTEPVSRDRTFNLFDFQANRPGVRNRRVSLLER